MTFHDFFNIALDLAYVLIAFVLIWTALKFLSDGVIIVRQYRAFRADVNKLKAH